MSQRWVLDFSLALLTMSFPVGCTEKPVEKIQHGSDYCDHCKMQITDKRFGGVILTRNGKSLKYDSMECLAHGHHDHKAEVKEVLVVDYKTQELLPLGKVQLYRNESVRGPMGTQIQGLSEPSLLPPVKLEEIAL